MVDLEHDDDDKEHVAMSHEVIVLWVLEFGLTLLVSGSEDRMMSALGSVKGCRLLNVPHLFHVGADSWCRSCFL